MPSHSTAGLDDIPGPNEPERCCCSCYDCACHGRQPVSDTDGGGFNDPDRDRTSDDYPASADDEPEVHRNPSLGLLALNAWPAQLHAFRGHERIREATTWIEAVQFEMETQRLQDLSQTSSMESSFTSAQLDGEHEHPRQGTSMAVDVDLERSFYASSSSSSSSSSISLLASDTGIFQDIGSQFQNVYFIAEPLPLAEPENYLPATLSVGSM